MSNAMPSTGGTSPGNQLPPLSAVIEVSEATWLTERRAAGYGYTEIGPLKQYAPMPVLFEGWKSTDKHLVVNYHWDFGDGTAVDYPGGFNAAHVYEVPGNYTITLTIKDKYNRTASASINIEVMAPNRNTYYVDAELGDDANDGLAPDRAWKTAIKAFDNLGKKFYKPGDRTLFKRGQTFTITPPTINHWAYGYGHSFAAYGEGPKPKLVLDDSLTTGGILLSFWASGLTNFSISDMEFDLTNSSGVSTSFIYPLNGTSQIMLLRIDLKNAIQGYNASNDGFFVVDCTSFNINSIHTFQQNGRLVLLNNKFENSASSHIAYLSSVGPASFIVGNTFKDGDISRCNLRICKGSNIYVAYNKVIGRKDLPAGKNTWLSVQLGPNTPNTMQIKNMTFERNLVENGDTLLNLGSMATDVIIRNNVFYEPFFTGDSMIIIGSKHGYDFGGCDGVYIYDNIIEFGDNQTSGKTSTVAHAFYVKDIDGLTTSVKPAAIEAVHKNIFFENNSVYTQYENQPFLLFNSTNEEVMKQVTINNNKFYLLNPTKAVRYKTTYSDYATWDATYPGTHTGNQLLDQTTYPGMAEHYEYPVVVEPEPEPEPEPPVEEPPVVEPPVVEEPPVEEEPETPPTEPPTDPGEEEPPVEEPPVEEPGEEEPPPTKAQPGEEPLVEEDPAEEEPPPTNEEPPVEEPVEEPPVEEEPPTNELPEEEPETPPTEEPGEEPPTADPGDEEGETNMDPVEGPLHQAWKVQLDNANKKVTNAKIAKIRAWAAFARSEGIYNDCLADSKRIEIEEPPFES